MKIFSKFQSGIKKTSNFLSSNIISSLKSKKIDKDVLDEIESILLSADLGVEVTNQLINKIKSTNISNQDNPNSILKLIAEELESILLPREKKLVNNKDFSPTILLFIGVNGISIKSHGNSNSYAVAQAINRCHKFIVNDLNSQIREKLIQS